MSSKSNPRLLRKQLEEYVPEQQPYYAFAESTWAEVDPKQQQQLPSSLSASPITGLRLVTWNIDFNPPCPQARMATALNYLQTLVESTPPSTAVIICLQELQQDLPTPLDEQEEEDDPYPDLKDDDEDDSDGESDHKPTSGDADDLGQIAASQFIRERFFATDLTTAHWRCPYNSISLVDRRLRITQVTRLPFVSEFQREAVIVDIALKKQGSSSISSPDEEDDIAPVIRICNVHLDSMSDPSHLRPIQWKACAKYLQDEGDGVVAGIVLGDCNANNASDVAMPEKNGFADAYLELGGNANDPEGHTWGLQSRSSRFPNRRMDKVCFCQQQKEASSPLKLKKMEKIGIGLRVEDDAARKELLERWGGLDFVTDHYGLMADFDIGICWRGLWSAEPASKTCLP